MVACGAATVTDDVFDGNRFIVIARALREAHNVFDFGSHFFSRSLCSCCYWTTSSIYAIMCIVGYILRFYLNELHNTSLCRSN